MTAWLDLRLYPALLLFYVSGLIAVASGQYHTFATLLQGPTFDDERERVPLSLKLAPNGVVKPDLMRQMQGKKYHTPVSEHLYEVLREPLRQFLPDDKWYDRTFDRFEYLFALGYADLGEKRTGGVRGPFGRFGWKDSSDPGHISQQVRVEAEKDGGSWPVLQSGLFEGSTVRFLSLKAQYDKRVASLDWAW